MNPSDPTSGLTAGNPSRGRAGEWTEEQRLLLGALRGDLSDADFETLTAAADAPHDPAASADLMGYTRAMAEASRLLFEAEAGAQRIRFAHGGRLTVDREILALGRAYRILADTARGADTIGQSIVESRFLGNDLAEAYRAGWNTAFATVIPGGKALLCPNGETYPASLPAHLVPPPELLEAARAQVSAALRRCRRALLRLSPEARRHACVRLDAFALTDAAPEELRRLLADLARTFRRVLLPAPVLEARDTFCGLVRRLLAAWFGPAPPCAGRVDPGSVSRRGPPVSVRSALTPRAGATA